MSFFKNVNVSDIPDDPNFIADGDYICVVVESIKKPTRNGDKEGLNIKWQITEGPYSGSFPVFEWIHTPEVEEGAEPTIEENKAFARLIQHFVAMGFTPDEYTSEEFGADDLLGRHAKIRMRNKPDKEGNTRAAVTGVFPIEEAEGDISDEANDVFRRTDGLTDDI